ncbi:MAG TPA: FKBP-type peptidyl-prolyl cis-trans isomerase [Solirubrobacteraceae bacterium]|nr:FKBP-type peptidyl-prolyl cis-trans isomerase [Solirubrobacteraceae bacterium]
MPRLLAPLLVAATAFAGVAAPPALADAPPKGKPKIVISGPKPKGLKIRDIKKGKGRVARNGDRLTTRYVMVTWSDGKEKDTSFGRGPFTFTLGAGEVIPGWDRGLKGMREGGRRRLTVPPSLAYGKDGSPPQVGPDETLVFVVDLLRVKRG